MRKYTKPNAEVIEFNVSDIITESGVIVNAETFTGSNAEMYKVYKENSTTDNTNVSVFTW